MIHHPDRPAHRRHGRHKAGEKLLEELLQRQIGLGNLRDLADKSPDFGLRLLDQQRVNPLGWRRTRGLDAKRWGIRQCLAKIGVNAIHGL